MNSRKYPGYGLCILVAVLGSICVFKFSESIEGLKIAKPLILFGRYSMVLVVLQTLSLIMFTASNNKQRLADMMIECGIVVCYAYVDMVIKNLLRQKNNAKITNIKHELEKQARRDEEKARRRKEAEKVNGRRKLAG